MINERSMTPQCRKIYRHLQRVGHITGDEAITYYRIMALPRRVYELQCHGVDIRKEDKRHPTTGQRYRRYHLVKEEAHV